MITSKDNNSLRHIQALTEELTRDLSKVSPTLAGDFTRPYNKPSKPKRFRNDNSWARSIQPNEAFWGEPYHAPQRTFTATKEQPIGDAIQCKNCGIVDDYTTRRKAHNNCAYCNGCGAWIKNLPYSNKHVLHFGRFKGEALETFTTEEKRSYLSWLRKTPDAWKKVNRQTQKLIVQILGGAKDAN